jgi:hypothetical protein
MILFLFHCPLVKLDDEAPLTLWNFALLSQAHVDPDCYLHTPRFDLSKLPESYGSYHEVYSQSDAAVSRSVMAREIDILTSPRCFLHLLIYLTRRKAIGVRWVYAYKYNPDGTIIRGKEKLEGRLAYRLPLPMILKVC